MTSYLEDKAVAANIHIKEKEYWLNKLSGQFVKASFPFGFPRPGVKEDRTGTIKFEFSEALFSKLMKISKQSDYTLHVILSAGLVVLLEKHTGLKDIIVGSPIYRQDVEGEFVNTILAIRSQIDDCVTFKDLLLQMRENIVEATENQNYPIETLIYKLNLESSENDFPLFDVAILVENIHDKRYIRNIDLNMIFSFIRTDEYVEGVVEYNSSLYRRIEIERIVNHFTNLLGMLFINPDINIADIIIISEEEKREILFDFNNTRENIPRESCFHQLFEEQVKKTPDRTAAVYNERQITYNELNEAGNRVAHFLLENGVIPGTIIALYIDRSIKMLTFIIGIFKTGGAYLPLDIDYPEERIKNILENSGVSILLTESDSMEVVDKIGDSLPMLENVYSLDGRILHEYSITNPKIRYHTDNLAYIIYTSGTTGYPKGVMIHQLGMINHLYAKINDLSITSDDIVAQTASVCFDISVWQFLAALLVGGTTLIIDKEVVLATDKFLKVLQERKITILESVPSLMTAFLERIEYAKDKELKYLRWMVPTGEALTVPLVKKWYRHYPGIKLLNAYGPTEASDDVTHYVVDEIYSETQTTIPIGKPLQNVHIYILDANLRLCPIGARGEICVAGIGVGKGYLNDIGKTEKFFLPNPYLGEIGDRDYAKLYKTGDIGYFRGDGNVECLGRIDHQVKIRGNRIELGEIESQLMQYDGIKEVVVMVRETSGGSAFGDESTDKYLCAYLISDIIYTASELREYLLRRLPDYMIPGYFVQLEEMPLTPNGKIDRKRLPEPETSGLLEEYTAPRNIVEEGLAEIWAEVLGVEKDMISIDDNFFELGGHSLKVAALVTNVHEEFDVNVPLKEIFKNPRIRNLSEYISKAVKDKYKSIDVGEKKEYYPLSSAQKRMYVVQQMETESKSYNMPTVAVLEGKLDREKLTDIFRKLIKRHESLRTSFIMPEDEPVQKIHEDIEFIVENYESEEEKSKEIVKNFIRPFDLTKAPLLRVGLIKIGEARHVLMIDMYHIISDGISFEILVKDFMTLYNGEELPTLRLQYRNFSEWQGRLVESGEVTKREEYWLNRFKDNIPVLNMPLDFPRPPVRSLDQGDLIVFVLEKGLSDKLHDIVKRTGTTLYMVLLAVCNILLSKYTNQEDIVVGSAVTGRYHGDLKNVIGFFVNMLPMRNQPERHKRFSDFLEEVKDNALDAFENEDFQFEELVAKLGLQGDSSRNPLFDVEFALNKIEEQAAGIPGLELKQYPYREVLKFAKFDLHFLTVERNDSVKIVLRYSTVLFKKLTIEMMKKYYIEILEQVVDNLDIKLGDIIITHDMLIPESKHNDDDAGDFEL